MWKILSIISIGILILSSYGPIVLSDKNNFLDQNKSNMDEYALVIIAPGTFSSSKNDIIFSITSSGCNILNLLLYNPKKIYSIDYNPYQNFLLELKIAALRNLDYSEFLQLMGLKFSNKNIEIYASIRENIGDNARFFWDKNSYVIDKGLLSVGEQNVKNLGNILRFFKGEKTIKDFFSCETIDKQADYFYKNIFGFPWKFSLFLAYNKYLIRLLLCLRILKEYTTIKNKIFMAVKETGISGIYLVEDLDIDQHLDDC